MKITLRQDWKAMIEGCTDEELEALDVEATQRAYATELEAAVKRDYPGAEIDVTVTDEYFRYGTVVEGVDDLTVGMTEAHLETITETVYSIGAFWRSTCNTR